MQKSWDRNKVGSQLWVSGASHLPEMLPCGRMSGIPWSRAAQLSPAGAEGLDPNSLVHPLSGVAHEGSHPLWDTVCVCRRRGLLKGKLCVIRVSQYPAPTQQKRSQWELLNKQRRGSGDL